MYYPNTRNERRVFVALLAISGIIFLAIVAYYILNPRAIIGDSLVNNPNGTPVELPAEGVSPFYVKPVTIMFATIVVFAFCLFTLGKKRIDKMPRSLRSILLVVALLGLAVSIYETLFNFVLWGSLMVTKGDPDTIVNIYPVNSIKINLVFATKTFVSLLFLSYFAYATLKNSLESAST